MDFSGGLQRDLLIILIMILIFLSLHFVMFSGYFCDPYEVDFDLPVRHPEQTRHRIPITPPPAYRLVAPCPVHDRY